MNTDENYMNLFAEIYRIAVKDDIAMVSKKTIDKLMRRGISKLKAREYINQHSRAIKTQIQKDIYQEAQNYGAGTRKMQIKHVDRLVENLVQNFGGKNDQK